MRYEYVLQTPCPNCNAPVLSFASYCCSEEADRWCKVCGLSDRISSKLLHDKLMYQNWCATNCLGSVSIHRQRWLTLQEETKHEQYRSAHPNQILFGGNYRFEDPTPEERAQFIEQMRACGIQGLMPALIGFVGNEQKFDKPWALDGTAKVA